LIRDKGFVLPWADLLKSVPYLLGFRRGQQVVGVYDALRLDDYTVGPFAECNEIPLLPSLQII